MARRFLFQNPGNQDGWEGPWGRNRKAGNCNTSEETSGREAGRKAGWDEGQGVGRVGGEMGFLGRSEGWSTAYLTQYCTSEPSKLIILSILKTKKNISEYLLYTYYSTH